MSKKRIFEKLKRFKFVSNLMSEFNEEEVGNTLILEVMDYKRKRQIAVDRQQSSPNDSTVQSVDQSREMTDQ